MIKTSLVALATVAAIAGVSVPAMADTSDSDSNDSYVRDAQIAQIQLHRQGVNANSVDEWNGLWRAFVINDDGTQTMQFFDKGTLAPVTL